MTAMIRCDGCGKTVPEDHTFGWLRMEREDVRMEADPDAWHFCSWSCVAAYTSTKVMKAA